MSHDLHQFSFIYYRPSAQNDHVKDINKKIKTKIFPKHISKISSVETLEIV